MRRCLAVAAVLAVLLISSAAAAAPGDIAPPPAQPAADDAALIDQGLAAYNNGDHRTALSIWQPIAERGNDRAQNNLGVLYKLGHGVQQDDIEAVKWFRRSAAQGHQMAQYSLGLNYMEGRGVAVDHAEARRLLRLSAEQGYADAQNDLGNLLYNGTNVTNDDAEAVKWFRRAALQGHAQAASNLGLAYAYGRGVLRNPEAAWYWFGQAAESVAPGTLSDAAAAARERVVAELGREIDQDITFEHRRTQLGDLYMIRPITAYDLLAAGEPRLALFGFNLAIGEMEDHEQSPESNFVLDEVSRSRIEALRRLGRTGEADQAVLALARQSFDFVASHPAMLIEAMTRLLATDPTNPDYLALRAEGYYVSGDDERYLEDTDARLRHETRPEQRPGAYWNRANAHARLGHLEASLADLDEAIRLDPSPLHYAGRAERHRQLGNPKAAIADLTAAIDGLGEHDGRARGYRFTRAELLLATGDPEAALADLDLLIDETSFDRDQYALRAEVLVALGLDERAEQDISRLIEADPDFAQTELRPRIEARLAKRQDGG
jgi:tetratricopeptide (TPR) repeat protein